MSDLVNWRLFAETFVTLFVIMDPPGAVPVFLALTASMSAKARARAARQATLIAFCVIVLFAVFGQQILNFMHISLPALQMSGGLLLLLIALDLLTGKSEDPDNVDSKANVAIVPLATPLLAGPGAIVAAMVSVQSAGSTPSNWAGVGIAIICVHVCLFLAMRFAGVIHRFLGESGVTLVTRIAGLLLAAIAVQLMADAVFAFIAAHS